MCMRVYVLAREQARARARVCVCVRACARASACAHACMYTRFTSLPTSIVLLALFLCCSHYQPLRRGRVGDGHGHGDGAGRFRTGGYSLLQEHNNFHHYASRAHCPCSVSSVSPPHRSLHTPAVSTAGAQRAQPKTEQSMVAIEAVLRGS